MIRDETNARTVRHRARVDVPEGAGRRTDATAATASATRWRRRASGLARRAISLAEQETAFRCRQRPLEQHTVFLESFGGNGMLCNPEAIFRALHAAPDLGHLRFVWVLSARGWSDPARSEFADDPRVTFVRRRSPAYYRALGSARYLINNATFPHAFAKRSGQIYLNTWHGTPLKSMGYGMPGGAIESTNIVRNFLCADYLLAPNRVTEKMYLDAYRMRSIYSGALLRVGTPRIDRQFRSDAGTGTRSTLRAVGVMVGTQQQVVLFAPTWRGSFARPDDQLDRLCSEVRSLSAGLRPGLRLLVKLHQRDYHRARADGRIAEFLVPNHVPTNDLLAVTDILVSDYSSIVVDFLTTHDRLVIYAPDAESYNLSRGFTVQPGELSAPVCSGIDDLVASVNKLSAADPHPTGAQVRERFFPYEDGNATARLVDIVFRGREAPGQVRREAPDPRPKLLMYCGGMQSNGVTTSALSLVQHLDYERFDVTVTYPALGAAPIEFDPRARVLPRLGGTTWTRVRRTAFPVVGGRLPLSERRLATDVRMADDWVRCFGSTHFDHLVDFGGYSAFFARLLRAGRPGVVSTWLHNDIHSEMESRDRSAWLRANLRRTTSMYGSSDHLVSVSPSLAALNAERFGNRVPAERFTFASNTIDDIRVRELARAPVPVGTDGRRLLMDSTGTTTFVTVGRLSEAKNHLRLVEAFAQVYRDRGACRLLVVGDGPMRAQLEGATRAAGVADQVTFAGLQSNPYALMARCDCFVLSSDYEGQPMVLLEALTLGLPIVTTDFGTVSGALPDGAGLVVGRDSRSLADGLRAYLDGAVPPPVFDSTDYNRRATAQFYRAIGADPDS